MSAFPAAAYQDLYRKGRVLAPGYRECRARYALIKPLLAKLRRPFTVLDIGTAQGYFAEWIATDFGARVLAIDAKASPHFVGGSPRVTYRTQRLTAADLAALGTFDVVLALSVLHHCTDWRAILAALPAMARARLIIETPNPAERLKQAVARADLAAIDKAVRALGKPIGTAPAVHQRTIARPIVLARSARLVLTGIVETGNGNHSRFAPKFAKRLGKILGYQPFPGSLNVRVTSDVNVVARLGTPAAQYVDRRSVWGGKHACDYQYWPARLVTASGAVQGHAMRPGKRGHGPDSIEFLAAVKLRDALTLADGDAVTLEVGA